MRETRHLSLDEQRIFRMALRRPSSLRRRIFVVVANVLAYALAIVVLAVCIVVALVFWSQ